MAKADHDKSYHRPPPTQASVVCQCADIPARGRATARWPVWPQPCSAGAGEPTHDGASERDTGDIVVLGKGWTVTGTRAVGQQLGILALPLNACVKGGEEYVNVDMRESPNWCRDTHGTSGRHPGEGYRELLPEGNDSCLHPTVGDAEASAEDLVSSFLKGLGADDRPRVPVLASRQYR